MSRTLTFKNITNQNSYEKSITVFIAIILKAESRLSREETHL